MDYQKYMDSQQYIQPKPWRCAGCLAYNWHWCETCRHCRPQAGEDGDFAKYMNYQKYMQGDGGFITPEITGKEDGCGPSVECYCIDDGDDDDYEAEYFLGEQTSTSCTGWDDRCWDPAGLSYVGNVESFQCQHHMEHKHEEASVFCNMGHIMPENAGLLSDYLPPYMGAKVAVAPNHMVGIWMQRLRGTWEALQIPQLHGHVTSAGGGAADFERDALLARHRLDLIHLPTPVGEHRAGDGIKMGEAVGMKDFDLDCGGFGTDSKQDSLLARRRLDLMHLPTTVGEHCAGDGIKMGEAIGMKDFDLDRGGFGTDSKQDSLLARRRLDLMHPPTTDGEHRTGDGIKMLPVPAGGTGDRKHYMDAASCMYSTA